MNNKSERKKKIIKALLKKKKDELRICIIGAGHGGLAMAAHLAIKGFSVNLFNRTKGHIKALLKGERKIKVEGKVEGFGKIKLATNDIKEAIKGVDIIMVVVPANGHEWVARACAPYIREEQIVVLNPGRTGGALEFLRTLQKTEVEELPFIAEAQTFLYASRKLGPAHAKIFAVKNAVPLATIPAHWIPGVVKVINRIFPQFAPGDNVFKTSFNNIGAIFHPALTVLNAAWIEQTHGNFDYYIEGASPSITKVLEVLDKERVSVAGALGFRAMSARIWLYTAYSATGKNLHEAILANPGYENIKAPDRLNHRYIDEDVPMSLVPIASIGDMLKVPTPYIKSIIRIASVMRGKDFWKTGRTVEKLGIKGMSIEQIRLLAVKGEI
ncbi:MAG: NAD/NADP octopine/nopaline dehydrogenase family protein [Candidatus Aenigmarchaeota archaeon]|nr:NAD/NADP octopine/nopaline dehydrogenase family protein [Candidatus Aenigmarchaeota archaeon]